MKRAFSSAARTRARPTRLLLNGGDNMLGRGVQLSFDKRTPGEEAIMDSMPARYYLFASLHPSDSDRDLSLEQIRAANKRGGRYLWGDYASLVIQPPPDLRVFNLETSVTETIENLDDTPIEKGIYYHMSVGNFATAMQGFAEIAHGGKSLVPYVVVFSNNHVLDFGRRVFDAETLPMMRHLLATDGASGHLVGAGYDIAEASRPAEVFIDGGGKVEVFAVATQCSGTPPTWSATERQSGIVVLPAIISADAVDAAYDRISAMVGPYRAKETSGVRILSIHWGPNWAYRRGYDVDAQQYRRMLAERVIDGGLVDIIYGHSSHHIRGMELYGGKLIIYGAGDLINDYEGFQNPGDEKYAKTGAAFIVDLDSQQHTLVSLRLVPLFVDRLSLKRLQPDSLMWHPPTRSMRRPSGDKSAVDALCDFVNDMSQLDAPRSPGTPIKLRVVDNDDNIPGGPVLAYP